MNIRQFYPLHRLPRQGQLWSWISFDVANQSFTLLINTLLFPVFFAKIVVCDESIDDRVWALTFGTSMLLAALFSPLAGAAADERAWKKRGLIGTGLLCGGFTCGLAWVQPGQIGWAVLLYIPANFCFAVGECFLASFLPGLAKQDQVGRVSGFSWAVAYVAALLLLGITALAMIGWNLQSTENWRPFFVFAGLWFIAFCIPTALWLREPAVEKMEHVGRNLWMASILRLVESVRGTAQHRDLAILLVASLFYGTGMSVVVFFASKLAAEFGFTQVDLVVFVGVITLSGIAGTILPTLYQDRIGHRRTVLILLWIWLATVIGFAGYAYCHSAHLADQSTAPFPLWPLWGIGNLLGFGLGSLGAANRAFVGYLAPPGKEAEIFGMWGMTWKLSAIMTFPFAWVKDTLGTPQSLILLAGFLGIGLIFTWFIDEKRGFAARSVTH